jgi:hypothetical protein
VCDNSNGFKNRFGEITSTHCKSKSLANQLGIHLILAKQEKLATKTKQAKIEAWQNSSMFLCRWESEKRNK